MCKNRKLVIAFANPRTEFGFENGKGFEIGAIWKVRYSIEKYDGYGKELFGREIYFDLKDMTFTGQFDKDVVSVNKIIHRHYLQLIQGDYQKAYKNLSKSFQSRLSYGNFVEGFSNVVFEKRFFPTQIAPNAFMQFSVPYYATSFVKHSSKTAVIDVQMSRFTENDYNFYRFYLIREKGFWRINKVKEISIDEFNKNN